MENKCGITSFVVDGQVFLLCDDKGLMTWNSHKAAIRWIKKFYTSLAKSNLPLSRKHYEDFDLRVHPQDVIALHDGRFEAAIVDHPGSPALEAEERVVDYMEVAKIYGIACVGKLAQSWHKNGIRPTFPTKF